MQPLTRDELDNLERLAEAATPGPWVQSALAELYIVPAGDALVIASVGEYADDGSLDLKFHNSTHNQSFIAAANPDTILRLIAMARRARETT